MGQWEYYTFAASGPFVTFQLLETGSNGSMWLFVSSESNPTLTDHDFQDMGACVFFFVILLMSFAVCHFPELSSQILIDPFMR